MQAGRVGMVALVLALAAPLQAASVTVSGGLVSVQARQVPLGALLNELNAYVPLEVMSANPQLPNQLVDIRLDGVPLDEAVGTLLAEAHVNFAIGGIKGEPLRVILGSSEAGGRPEQATSQGAPAARAHLAATGGQPLSREEVKARAADWHREQQAKAEAQEAEQKAASDAERDAEQVPATVSDDPGVPAGYSMVGESVTYNDPNFVPLKNRPEVRNRRLSMDLSKIP